MLSEAATMRFVRRRRHLTIAAVFLSFIVLWIVATIDRETRSQWLWLMLVVVAVLWVWLIGVPFITREGLRAMRRELQRADPKALIVLAEVSNTDDAGLVAVVTLESDGVRLRWPGNESGFLLPWGDIRTVTFIRPVGEQLRLDFRDGDRLWLRVLSRAAVNQDPVRSGKLLRAIDARLRTPQSA